jgi:hypothetical protein
VRALDQEAGLAHRQAVPARVALIGVAVIVGRQSGSSVECERAARERAENAKLIVEAGIEPTAKRRCEHCGGNIPRWRNGRQVADSDEVARAFRDDVARCSDMMSPRCLGWPAIFCIRRWLWSILGCLGGA